MTSWIERFVCSRMYDFLKVWALLSLTIFTCIGIALLFIRGHWALAVTALSALIALPALDLV